MLTQNTLKSGMDVPRTHAHTHARTHAHHTHTHTQHPHTHHAFVFVNCILGTFHRLLLLLCWPTIFSIPWSQNRASLKDITWKSQLLCLIRYFDLIFDVSCSPNIRCHETILECKIRQLISLPVCVRLWPFIILSSVCQFGPLHICLSSVPIME